MTQRPRTAKLRSAANILSLALKGGLQRLMPPSPDGQTQPASERGKPASEATVDAWVEANRRVWYDERPWVPPPGAQRVLIEGFI
ncbi:MAG: hypothetical protein R3185_09320, partial [Candidatus Thermoplasmatota archaeon]|nr:hypothetical protein [Candidatus Thermoplasmatota archaeon]